MSASGLTGAQAAEMILRRNGVLGVTVQHVAGELTDHYDPARGVVNLSDATYNSTSVAAIGVAAHECGHVMQHPTEYLPLKIRTALVPVANIGSNVGIWIVMLGLILGLNDTLAMIGIYLFSFGVFFQLVTLPVEFDASRRALVMLQDYGILGQTEVQGSRSVLSAAAMTYVASAAASVLQLLRLLMIVNGGRRRR
jgi:Zn-dependent membrane protease YugP